MSGHNKWANIKARKGSQDAKRGKMFTKIAKEIIVAARLSGADPDNNPRLRAAIQAGRAINMPNDNIKRAIARGAGADGADAIEEVLFEGFGTAGVAILVEAQTDNRNRTTGEIRHLFAKYNGNMGVQGCAIRNFQRQGQITIPAEGLTEEKVFEAALEAGADDVQSEEDTFVVLTAFENLNTVTDNLQKAGIPVSESRPVYNAVLTVKMAGDHAKGLLKLIDALEDNDDVANVWANFDIDDKDLEAFEAE
jgi:YebC/PmpR family DNA-binding regulatory protein